MKTGANARRSRGIRLKNPAGDARKKTHTTIEVSLECADEATATALSEVLMPDNRYFPKDQSFEASRRGSIVRFVMASPRARPMISTVTSIILDARLFRDVWVEAKTRGLGNAQR